MALHGGFMTNWMLGHHPGAFVAAVSENRLTDLVGEDGALDIGIMIGREAVGEAFLWEHPRESPVDRRGPADRSAPSCCSAAAGGNKRTSVSDAEAQPPFAIL